MKFFFGLILIIVSLQASAAWETIPPLRNTYSTSSVQTPGFQAPYATPTDICMIGNPTNRVLTLHHIRVSGIQTTGGENAFFIVKRSSLDTCPGKPLVAVPHDSQQPASYSDIQWCTSAPSLGTYVGTLRATDVLTPATTGTSAPGVYDWDFGPNTGTQPIVLHLNEMIAINFSSMAVPSGMQLACEFSWQEQ